MYNTVFRFQDVLQIYVECQRCHIKVN